MVSGFLHHAFIHLTTSLLLDVFLRLWKIIMGCKCQCHAKKWVEEEELVGRALFLLSDWGNGPNRELSQFLQASPKLVVMTRWPLVLEGPPPPKETATHERCFFLAQPQKKWCYLSTQIKNHVLLLPQSLQKRLMIDRNSVTQFPPFIQTAKHYFQHHLAKRPMSILEQTCKQIW